MTRRNIYTVGIIGCILITFTLSSVLQAQVRQSTNYQLRSDSINIGGGFSSSTNYQQESTVAEIATGESNSASYRLRAGYQQMQVNYIAVSDATNVLMSPSLSGVSGGSAQGSTTVRVTTDSSAGYTLSIKSQSSPALQSGGDSFADYTPVGAPDFSFITGASDAHFGYSPAGVDVADRFLDNGALCNTGSLETAGACWDGLSMTDEIIATASDANHPNGATTTINFRAEIGSAVVQPPGTYLATTTLTALSL